MKYTKIGNQQFYTITLFVLVILFIRQIGNISFLDNYGNMILGPLILIGFLFLGRQSSFNIREIAIFLIYFIISLAASLFFGHNDFLKIFSEVLSLFLFIVIIPSIKASEWEIEKIFMTIYILLIILITMKTLIDFGIISNAKYIFSNKNSWAQALMFLFFISFYLFVKKNEKKYVLLALVALILIILSQSRTAIVATFTFILFFYLVMSKRIKHKFIFLIMIFGFSIFFTLADDSLMIFITDNYTRSEYNLLTNRDLLWGVAQDAFMSSPVFGVGRGAAEEIISHSGIGMKNSEYHSFYFEVLAYGGIISALLYGYLFVGAYINGCKLKRLNSKLSSVVLSAMIAIFVYMLAETFYPFGISFNNYIAGIFLFSIPAMYIKGNIKSDFNK